MADISQITLPSGSTYNIKDAYARELIESIETSITGAMSYVGTTTTALTDGANTNPITINGASHTAKSGDVAIYGNKEFVFNGTVWNEFGDMGSLRALAFKDTASASYTPEGTVSQPTFNGATVSNQVYVHPAGTISGREVDIAYEEDDGHGGTTIVYEQPNYTPTGYVRAPSITVTPSTTTVNSITAVGTLPSWTANVSNENLTLGWSAGTLPTKGSDTTVATNNIQATSTNPTFVGTGAVFSFTGDSEMVSFSIKCAGTVTQPTFTGTPATITVS